MSLKRIVTLALVFYSAICLTRAANYWIHVRVDEGAKEESVKVNLPVALLETALPLIENEAISKGKVKLASEELNLAQLRQIWAELKANGNYELASITTKEERLRISLEGNEIFVRSAEGAETNISVNLPTSVVDALLSGEGEELNVSAGVAALVAAGPRDLVTIKETGKLVRVWIDEQSTGE